MLEVVSISGFSDEAAGVEPPSQRGAVTARRGGLVHGTKVASTSGWKRVEKLKVGDLVRTVDDGFKEVRRVSTDLVTIPAGETRADCLPVQVPSRAAYNGRVVWLMPEQGMAIDHSKIDPSQTEISVVAARLLSGTCRLRSRAPASSFEVTTLFFDQDQVIFIEGGLQAYCPAARFGTRPGADQKTYQVIDGETAMLVIDAIADRGNMAALANPLGALPAPVPGEPIFPMRPATGQRRPGRPGRPPQPTLFLRPEWMMLTHQ
ncbi:Hint domain-containing protein [Ruegeria sp.]|uniref:Hint domain-containing protein n=1 Tax=Ruegeria sp. TaxID=1879320 RepID=UPI003C7E70E0